MNKIHIKLATNNIFHRFENPRQIIQDASLERLARIIVLYIERDFEGEVFVDLIDGIRTDIETTLPADDWIITSNHIEQIIEKVWESDEWVKWHDHNRDLWSRMDFDHEMKIGK